VIATAPGKLILTGEYAVLQGAPALVIAVNRRVVATRRTAPRGSSPFLLAVADEIAKRYGADHPATRAAMEIVVDSSMFYQGKEKLGLGSSAAVTVAATALALAGDSPVPVIDRDAVLQIASEAHAAAQGPRGSRGSGADIAAAVHGGVIAFQKTSPDRIAWPSDAAKRGRAITFDGPYNFGEPTPQTTQEQRTAERLDWPSGVRVLTFYTGSSGDTATLVAAVARGREANSVAVDAAMKSIEQASRAACQACAMRAPEIANKALIAALALGSAAIDQLAAAAGVRLVPDCVTAARGALTRLGGTAKTTGAGGGDIGIAVIPATEDVTIARRLLIEAGCQPLSLAVDTTGVDLQPNAQ
jgi:phosphomevalonate kinase